MLNTSETTEIGLIKVPEAFEQGEEDDKGFTLAVIS
jgi:hypothetical protein